MSKNEGSTRYPSGGLMIKPPASHRLNPRSPPTTRPRRKANVGSPDSIVLDTLSNNIKRFGGPPPRMTEDTAMKYIYPEFSFTCQFDGTDADTTHTFLDTPAQARLRMALKVAWLKSCTEQKLVKEKDIRYIDCSSITSFLSTAFEEDQETSQVHKLVFRAALCTHMSKDPIWFAIGCMIYADYSIREFQYHEKLLKDSDIWDSLEAVDFTRTLDDVEPKDLLEGLGSKIASAPKTTYDAFCAFPSYYGKLPLRLAMQGCLTLLAGNNGGYPGVVIFRHLSESLGVSNTYQLTAHEKKLCELLPSSTFVIPYRNELVYQFTVKRIQDGEGYSETDEENQTYIASVQSLMDDLRAASQQPDLQLVEDIVRSLPESPQHHREAPVECQSTCSMEDELSEALADAVDIMGTRDIVRDNLLTSLPEGLLATQGPHIKAVIESSNTTFDLLKNLSLLVGPLMEAAYKQGAWDEKLKEAARRSPNLVKVAKCEAKMPQRWIHTEEASHPVPSSSTYKDTSTPNFDNDRQAELDGNNVTTILDEADSKLIVKELMELFLRFKSSSSIADAIKKSMPGPNFSNAMGPFMITQRQVDAIREAERREEDVSGLEGMINEQSVHTALARYQENVLNGVKLSGMRYKSEVDQILRTSPFGMIPWLQSAKVLSALTKSRKMNITYDQTAIVVLSVMRKWYIGKPKNGVSKADLILLNSNSKVLP